MIITRSRHWRASEDEALYYTARKHFEQLKQYNNKIMLDSDLAKTIFEDYCLRVNNRPCKMASDVMYRMSKLKLVSPRVPIKTEGYVFNSKSMLNLFDVPPPSFATFLSDLKASPSDLECTLGTLKETLGGIGEGERRGVNEALSVSLHILNGSIKDARVRVELTKLNLLFACIEYKLMHLDNGRPVVNL